jgi:hypothetical protein
VGNDGETLVADSSTSTGLRWQGDYAAGKNKIINGDFGIWQRGTTFTNPAVTAYTADRWQVQHDGTGATRTISQQTFTPGSAPVAGYEGQYFYRYAVSVVGTGNTFQDFRYNQEDVRTFAGQTVTISFWAKADASRVVNLLYRTEYGSGGSSANQFSVGSVTLTTSWVRYTVTYAVPSVSGLTIGSGSYGGWIFRPIAATAQTIDVWGVQIEAGSVATAFQTATGTLQGELAACQRYYEQSAPPGTVLVDGMSGTVNGVASGYSGSDLRTQRFDFKVTKRTTPTMTYYRSNDGSTAGRWVYYVSGWTTPTGQSNSLLTQDSFAVYMTGSFTTRDCYIVEGGGWSASAEL